MLVGAAVVVVLVMGVPMAVSAFGSSQSVDQTLAKMRSDQADKQRQTKATLARTAHLKPQVQALAWNVSPDQLRQEIVRKLSLLAGNAGLTLVTTRPLKPRPLDVMTEVSVDLHLTGTLPGLVKFLYPLQAPTSRLTVDRLRMSATNADTDLLDIDMTVSGYTLQVPAEATGTGARRTL